MMNKKFYSIDSWNAFSLTSFGPRHGPIS